MTEETTQKVKAYQLTVAGREWTFTPEAADALGGFAGLVTFAIAVGSTVKGSSTEVNFKGYGLFMVARHGKRVRVTLLEAEGGAA